MADAAPKKSALLIAIGGKPRRAMGSDPGADDADTDDDDGTPKAGELKTAATEDVMSAFKSGDTAALEDALTRFVQACSSEGYAK
jgi:hypothetical protein